MSKDKLENWFSANEILAMEEDRSITIKYKDLSDIYELAIKIKESLELDKNNIYANRITKKIDKLIKVDGE